MEAQGTNGASEKRKQTKRPAEQSAASQTGSSGSGNSDAAGASTGGFETMLGSVVIAAGVCTPEEVQAAQASIESAKASGEHGTLVDELVSREYLTRHQLNRLRNEFEAKRSSQRIPGFQVIKKLGAGAMATVYLAKQLSLDRLVAIKILPKKFSTNEKFIERFYKEGRAAAQLNHPNIVAAFDVGSAGEHHYFVMEYVDGPTIFDHCVKHKRFKEKEAIDIVRQVAKALQHAHEQGFVHRDIKPKNIMITKQGRVKLADLGLARAISDQEAAKAEAGRAYGTPYYISPEQIRGEVEIGPQADIYGLGATFYHMVTGRVPFEGKNPSAVMHKHLKNPLDPPDHVNPNISSGCAQVIEMMMAKSRRDRYQNVGDLMDDLDLLMQDKPPHFAHRDFGHSSVTKTLTAIADAAPAAPPTPLVQTRGSSPWSGAMLGIAAGLGISVLINIILLMVIMRG